MGSGSGPGSGSGSGSGVTISDPGLSGSVSGLQAKKPKSKLATSMAGNNFFLIIVNVSTISRFQR